MKEQQYNEMCGFLANDEKKLAEFKEFYRNYKDSDNYDKLFDNKFGFIYRKLTLVNQGNDVTGALGSNYTSKKVTNTAELSKNDISKDIKIIRRWVQFFGWVTIIGIVISVIAGIVIGLSAS